MLPITSESPMRLSDDGLTRTSSITFELPLDKDFTTLTPSSNLVSNTKDRKRTLFIPECPRPIKRRRVILTDSESNSNLSTPITPPSPTSDPDLISIDPDSKGFWTLRSEAISEKLWLPTEIASVDLHSTYSNTFSNILVPKSQWKVNWIKPQSPNSLKICWPSSPSSPQGSMVCEDITNEPKMIKTMKVRLFPTVNQKNILRQWMGTVRFLYNKANQAVKEKRATSGFQKLRQTILRDENLLKENEWLKQIPNAVKQTGIKQLSEAYNTNFVNKKKFEVRYKSKKLSKTEVAQFDKRSVSFSPCQKQNEASVSLMPRYLGPMKVVDSKKFIRQLVQMKKPQCEVKIQYHYRTGAYFLIIPIEYRPLPPNVPEHREISIDPGVRTFATCYSPSGGVGKLPVGGDIGMRKRYNRIDHIQSALTKIKSMKVEDRRSNGFKSKNINRMTKKIHRLWMEIDNAKHHMHYNVIKFLLDNFEKIVIPDFNPHEMSGKQTSILSKSTKRKMFCWGHGQFRQRLKTKAVMMGRKNDVIITTEEYTSKTCGCCGRINWKLGSSEKFECDGCGTKMDRDVNGARNILLKYLTEKERVDVEGPKEEMIDI